MLRDNGGPVHTYLAAAAWGRGSGGERLRGGAKRRTRKGGGRTNLRLDRGGALTDRYILDGALLMSGVDMSCY